MEEAVGVTVDIYVAKLRELQRDRRFRIFVHPVPPVLDVTRDTVLLFNRILEERLAPHCTPPAGAAAGGGGGGELRFLPDLAAKLLGSDGRLRPQFSLDGTHLHPAYIPLLQDSLNAALGPA